MTGGSASVTLSRMVNLLGPRPPNAGLALLEAEPHGRVEARLAILAELVRRGRIDGASLEVEALEVELEELDQTPSRISALACLEAIDGLRRDLAGKVDAGPSSRSWPGDVLARGDYVGHRPGRSLSSGEAEIASRGYFDVADRPPIGCWIGLLAPGSGASRPHEEAVEDLVIVAWIPEQALVRARAGCLACPNGALGLLSELAPVAHLALRALEARARRR